MLPHILDTHGRDKVSLLLSGIFYLPVLLVMLPYAERERPREKHNCAEPQQPASGPARSRRPTRRFGSVATGWRQRRLGWRHFEQQRLFEVVHSGTSSKTPWAGLPSLPLRSIANR